MAERKKRGLGRGLGALIPDANSNDRPVDVFFSGGNTDEGSREGEAKTSRSAHRRFRRVISSSVPKLTGGPRQHQEGQETRRLPQTTLRRPPLEPPLSRDVQATLRLQKHIKRCIRPLMDRRFRQLLASAAKSVIKTAGPGRPFEPRGWAPRLEPLLRDPRPPIRHA